MATVPGICDECGAIFGAEALTGAEGCNIDLSGAKVGPCANCGADGSVPEGTFDLIFDTLRVAKEAAIEKVIFDAIIEGLEDRAAGKVTDAEVMERVEATAPGLAPTVKGYLAKSDPASWIAMLISPGWGRNIRSTRTRAGSLSSRAPPRPPTRRPARHPVDAA